MSTAREIIRGALTFRLNRLSPGEAEDADTFNTCLLALNAIADEWNGVKSFLFREIRTAGTVTTTGTLGTTWATLVPGDKILGATYSDNGDWPIEELTMRQYHERISDKTTTGNPQYWIHDGLATVYFYPVPTSLSITLRTKAAVSDFADLDTNYSMPAGYKAALQDCLAERLSPVMAPEMFSVASKAASAARLRIGAQTSNPAILSYRGAVVNILNG